MERGKRTLNPVRAGRRCPMVYVIGRVFALVVERMLDEGVDDDQPLRQRRSSLLWQHYVVTPLNKQIACLSVTC